MMDKFEKKPEQKTDVDIDTSYDLFENCRKWESFLSENGLKKKYLGLLCPYCTKYGGCNHPRGEGVCSPMKCPQQFCRNCSVKICKHTKGKLDWCKLWEK